MASWRDDLILEGEFLLLPKRKGLHQVTLTRCGLFFNLATSNSTTYEEKSLQISDIVGCHCLEHTGNAGGGGSSATGQTTTADAVDHRRSSLGSENDGSEFAASVGRYFPRAADSSACGFIVFAYPFRKKMFSSKKVRHRQVVAFEVLSSSGTFEERRKTAEKWRNVINCCCRDLPVNVNDIPSCVPPPRGKLLLLINPYSGPGKAYTIFKNEVAPMLYEACIPYKAVITEYAGHASEIMKTLTLSEWYGVVIISGDGLIFETINGIMQRADWASSIKLPVGCLPGGSGNALCCAINYSAGEPIDSSMVLHSTFVLIKHRVVPMDLVVVHIPDKTLFSFLSVTWGIMADIDFESEKYRNLGEARFTVGAIKRIIGLRTYRGRISFLPVAEYTPRESASSQKILSKIRRFSLRSRSSSKSTLNSLDSRGSDSPKLLKHQSLNLDQNGYSNQQLAGGTSVDDMSVEEAGVNAGATSGHSGNGGGRNFTEQVDGHSGSEFGQGDCVLRDGEAGGGIISADNGINKDITAHGAGDFLVTNPAEPTTTESIAEGETTATSQQLQSNDTEMVNDISPSDRYEDHFPSSSNNLGLVSHSENDGNSQLAHDHNKTTQGAGVEKMETSQSANSVEYNSLKHYAADGCNVKHSCSMTILSETQEIGVEEETYHGRKADFGPVPTPLLHPLDQEVPSNWVTLEGNFILAAAVYQTHLGSDMLAAPDAHLCDGHINLMMVREGISRNALLNLFLSFGQGGHVHSPYVDSVKVLAFRLEPETTNGNIMVDGERFSPSPIQGQILPGLARIMAIK